MFLSREREALTVSRVIYSHTGIIGITVATGTSVAKVRRNCQTCGVNLSGTTKCGVTTPHSQLSVMQRKFCENENFTLK